MRNLEIKLLLPYNWGHIRKIGVYDNHGNRLAKIMHGEHHTLKINNNVTHIIVKLDFYRSEIAIPENTTDLHLALYLDFRDGFPFKYIDTFKRKCLTGTFLNHDEFENFTLAFYANALQWVPASKIDTPGIILGMLISGGLLVTSVVQQDNYYQDLLFFIGAASMVAMVMIYAERGRILLYDYKSRMVATVLAFVLAFFFLIPSFAVNMLFFIFISLFILRTLTNVSTIKAA